jgi:hypothetical protein
LIILGQAVCVPLNNSTNISKAEIKVKE